MKKIACIGSITIDIIVNPADDIPPLGTLRAVSGVEMHVGGCAANAAIDLAKLGIPSELICCIGDDNFGAFIESICKKNNVGLRGIFCNQNSTTTGCVVCVSSKGERSFLYNPGSTADFKLEDINMDVIQESDILFVAGAFLLTDFDGVPCSKLMKKAREMQKFTVMDTAWDFEDKWLPKIKDVLPYLDLFMPSYDEAVKITGKHDLNEIADMFFDAGVKSVIIKTGKDGAFICENHSIRYNLPTYLSIKPIDTTGAGDSFCAGFLAGLAMGWNYKESGKFANAVGTHCIMQIGASSGIKPIKEILEFMEIHQNEEITNDY